MFDRFKDWSDKLKIMLDKQPTPADRHLDKLIETETKRLVSNLTLNQPVLAINTWPIPPVTKALGDLILESLINNGYYVNLEDGSVTISMLPPNLKKIIDRPELNNRPSLEDS